jgi:regulator of nonsense transcripts 2
MDIDFLVQDTYALTRPQWKLATSFEEAGRAFADLIAHNHKSQGTEKTIDTELMEDGISSSDEADEDEPPVPEMEDGQSSSEEIEADVRGI